jgi:hypothetical protein
LPVIAEVTAAVCFGAVSTKYARSPASARFGTATAGPATAVVVRKRAKERADSRALRTTQ